MKNQKGITAISMVIIIVVLILLAGYSVLTSREIVTEANIEQYFQEIKLVSDQVKGISLDKNNFKETFRVFKIEDISQYNARVGNKLLLGEEYYLLAYGDEGLTDVMRQIMNEILDVRSVKNSYIISYVDVGNVNVYLLDGIRIGEEYCYTYEDIHKTYSNINKK